MYLPATPEGDGGSNDHQNSAEGIHELVRENLDERETCEVTGLTQPRGGPYR
jgi:hypothetical protein